MANDFLPFGIGGGANVIDQATWQALPARPGGFIAGTALSAQLNKVWRQGSVMAYVVGEIIAQTGRDALDDGDIEDLVDGLNVSLRAQTLNFPGTAGGTGTALTLTLDPIPASWNELRGTPFRVVSSAVNGATPTLNINGLGAKSIVWPDGSAIAANAWGIGTLLEFLYDGTNVRVLSGTSKLAAGLAPVRFVDATPGTRNFTAAVTGWHRIELHGGGGGGGGGQTPQGCGGGGGGGGHVVDFVYLTEGVNYSYTIGFAGPGGGIAISGSAGGSTSFTGPSGLITATGGAGGQGAASPTGGVGGGGGAGSGYSSRGYLDYGQGGYQGSPQITQSGQGGSSVSGGFGGQASFGGGNSGSSPGGGGSGSVTNAAGGGNGGVGRLVVEYF